MAKLCDCLHERRSATSKVLFELYWKAKALNGRGTRVWQLLICFGLAASFLSSVVAMHVCAQTPGQVSAQADDQPGVSAEEVIDLLQRDPGFLEAAKGKVAQAWNVNPSTIDDETLFDHIRQDANLRDLVGKELDKRGYNPGTGAAPINGMIPAAAGQSSR